MNYIWLILMLLAVIIGAYEHTLPAVVASITQSAKNAVTLALGLAGIMALWLGLMKIAEEAGLIQVVAKVINPIMRKLFKEVPKDHPAMGAMIMNIAANFLGLGNAATPFGLRAMEQLEKLNPTPGRATDAMCMFLAINTSSIQLIPATAIAILSVNGANNPASIILPALLATTCSTLAAITAAKLCAFFSERKQNTLEELV